MARCCGRITGWASGVGSLSGCCCGWISRSRRIMRGVWTRRPGEMAARWFLARKTLVDLLPDAGGARVLYLLPVPVTVAGGLRFRSPCGRPGSRLLWRRLRLGLLWTGRIPSGWCCRGCWTTRCRCCGCGQMAGAWSADRTPRPRRHSPRRPSRLTTASDAGSAARQLRAAWECVHALRADPVKAYAEAVKAVESAAHAVVEPRQGRATLGTMLRHLKADRGRFSLVIPGPDGAGDIGPVIECMKLLWEGQTSRHGSSRPTREETLEEAAMAVDLAVMLVRWFTSGAVRRSVTG